MGNKWIKQKEEDCRCYDSNNLPPRKRHAKLMQEAQKVYKMERPSAEVERLKAEIAGLKKSLETIRDEYEQAMETSFQEAYEIICAIRTELENVESDNDYLRKSIYALLDHKKTQREQFDRLVRGL